MKKTTPLFMLFLSQEPKEQIGPDTWVDAIAGRTLFKSYPWMRFKDLYENQMLNLTLRNEPEIHIQSQIQRLEFIVEEDLCFRNAIRL